VAAGGTRTCIHTPGAAFDPKEMTTDLVSTALQDAALVYFDGRLTEAALLLARAARAAGVPVLVEGERLRPGLQDLLAEADYVVTSAHFPQVGPRPDQGPSSCPSETPRNLYVSSGGIMSLKLKSYRSCNYACHHSLICVRRPMVPHSLWQSKQPGRQAQAQGQRATAMEGSPTRVSNPCMCVC